MDGYFIFTIEVRDSRKCFYFHIFLLFMKAICVFSAPENHTDLATVQVFIITDENRVELTFENPLAVVIGLQDIVNYFRLYVKFC